MRRNSKSKVFTTMLDMICDFLVITKEANNGLGVQFPRITSSSIQITQSKMDGGDSGEKRSYQPYESKPIGISQRPMTSGAPVGAAKTAQNFFPRPNLNEHKPNFNGFLAGSDSEANMKDSTTQDSRPYEMGRTGADSSSFNDARDEQLRGFPPKNKNPILLNQSSADEIETA